MGILTLLAYTHFFLFCACGGNLVTRRHSKLLAIIKLMSYPQNGKQENELGTEIVMFFVQETSKHILRYYHIDSIFKRGEGKETQKTKF